MPATADRQEGLPVDHDEADHLRREVRRLGQSRARWRAVAGLLAGVVAVLLLASAVSGLLLGRTWADRQREEEARRREAEERLGREEALFLERRKEVHAVFERVERRHRAREQAEALAPVAGGLAAAALEPADD
jgi:hypothetical protein